MSNDRGATTIQSLIVACTFMFMFIVTFKSVLKVNSFNELQRRTHLVSQNKLMTYDKFIFNDFGILTYISDDFTSIAYDQFRGKKYKNIDYNVLKLKLLSQGDELEKQVKRVVKSRIPYETLNMPNTMKGDSKASTEFGDILIGAGISASGNDKLNMSEYAVGAMSDRVVSMGRETSLFNKESEHPFMENGQVEYVITGNKSVEGAHNEVYIRIFAIRELTNAIYISNSEEDMAEVKAKALAIVAASEGNISYDAAEKTVIAAMATMRSKEDLDLLLEGEYISFDGSKRLPGVKKVYYDDYLRLLLTTVGMNDFKNRIFYVIEGNITEKFGIAVDLKKAYVGHVFSVNSGGREVARSQGQYFED